MSLGILCLVYCVQTAWEAEQCLVWKQGQLVGDGDRDLDTGLTVDIKHSSQYLLGNDFREVQTRV